MKNNQVFINCPFDEEYTDILRALVFSLCFLGFTPRLASEFLNSADNRIEKICELINQSNYSIHDLSRCKSTKIDEYYRMNMPFEFGIDYGNSFFNQLNKKMLVLEGQRYDFQKTISDLSGVDTKCHNNEPEDVMRCIRNWLIEAKILNHAESATVIWYRFTDFTSDFYDSRKALGFTDKDLNEIPIAEYIVSINDWISRLS